VGAVPLAWFLLGRADGAIESFRHAPKVLVTTTEMVASNGSRIAVANLDGADQHRQLYSLEQAAEFTFDPPALLASIRISGDHLQVLDVKGVQLPWASETEMRGIIEEGDILYSLDGNRFVELQRLDNHISYSAYPVTFALAPTPGPVRAIQIRARKLYLDHKEWILGNVEFFGRNR